MKRFLYLFFFLHCFLAGNSASGLRGSGLGFTENKGQVTDYQGNLRPDILFTADGGGKKLFIRNTGISYVLLKSDPIPEEAMEDRSILEGLNYYSHRVDVDFIGCNTASYFVKLEEVEGYKNFYYPHCNDGITYVKSYNTLLQKNIYNNVDILYKGGKSQGLKYDIIINPGGNLEDVMMRYSGQNGLKIENGNIVATTSLGALTEHMPKVYQQVDGNIIDVKAWYEITDEKNIIIKTGNYNKNYPLIIDPWATYLGDVLNEYAFSITADGTGDITFVGWTVSINFPTLNASQNTLVGFRDCFISKMTAAGTLIWSTYYGGGFDDTPYGVHADAATDEIYFCGSAGSANFPMGAAAGQTSHQNTHPGGESAILVKLTPAGTRLWATFYGGASITKAYDVTTDANGNVLIAGVTASTNNIATGGTFQPALAGGDDNFVAKFSPTGVRTWGSYLGGSGNESYGSISCDAANNVYLSGTTLSTNLLVTAGAYQPANAGGTDAFLFKLDPTGQRIWGTYYGGILFESSFDTKVDNAGDVYITGSTNSIAGISTPGSFQPANGGGTLPQDAFLAKFNSGGTLLWATYLGGNTRDYAMGIAIGNNNNVIVGGDTYSNNFPVTSCASQTTFHGAEDQFITTFSPNGNVICSGYIGIGNVLPPSADNEVLNGGGCIASSGGFVYLIAQSPGNFPVTPGCYQSTCSGLNDAAIAKLCATSCGLTTIQADFTASKTNLCVGESVNFSLQNTSCSQLNTTYLWTFNGAAISNSTVPNPSGISYPTTGNYPVKVVITTPCGKDSIEKSAYIRVSSVVTNTINISACNSYVQDGQTLTASGIYTFTLPHSSGCDSILTVNLTVTNTYADTVNVEACSSHTYNGQTYTTSGIYSQTLTGSAGCDSILTLNLSISTASLLAIYPATDSIYIGNTITLTATGTNSYVWDNGATTANIVITPTQHTTYCVIGSNGNCSDTICSNIYVWECVDGKLFIPSAFSPNGDGQNDELCVYGTQCLETFQLSIYNRWGELVFQSDDPVHCWDGTYKNSNMNNTVFTFALNAISKDKKHIELKGNITLVK